MNVTWKMLLGGLVVVYLVTFTLNLGDRVLADEGADA